MTRTVTETFTLTHAKYLASKVTADMRRCQQIYGKPTDSERNDFGTELALLLNAGCVENYEFGYRENGSRLVSWSYSVGVSGLVGGSDDRPGRIHSGVNTANAQFFNFLTYSSGWSNLTTAERERLEQSLPIRRGLGEAPRDGFGYWETDLCYSASGVALSRRTFRPYTS